MLYNYTDKLILKTGYDPKNEMKYPDNSDNSFDVDDYIFFLHSCSAYCFCIPKMIFVGARRRRFDQISADLFRVSH